MLLRNQLAIITVLTIVVGSISLLDSRQRAPNINMLAKLCGS